MCDDFEDEDNKVGYGKPPKRGQFKKGVSGNPSGRPKKATDFESQLKKELNSVVFVTERGKQRATTKFELALKQLANKAASGNLPAMRLLTPWYQKALERAAEERQSAADKAKRTAKDLSDDELMALILAEEEKSVPVGTDGRKPGNRRKHTSIQALHAEPDPSAASGPCRRRSGPDPRSLS
jgi:hypothetical protein